jgi:hypothetical protein
MTGRAKSTSAHRQWSPTTPTVVRERQSTPRSEPVTWTGRTGLDACSSKAGPTAWWSVEARTSTPRKQKRCCAPTLVSGTRPSCRWPTLTSGNGRAPSLSPPGRTRPRRRTQSVRVAPAISRQSPARLPLGGRDPAQCNGKSHGVDPCAATREWGITPRRNQTLRI